MPRWGKRSKPARDEPGGSTREPASQGPESAGPGFVSRERARFIHDEGPLLLIAGDEATEALPALRLERGRPARCDGWRLVARLTLCVVDGPGDAGFLVQALDGPAEAGDQSDWLRSVEATGGAVVVAAEGLGEVRTLDEAAACSDVRGGFVSLAPG